LSLVLDVRRHCEDVTSDGGLIQVLVAVTGNAWSPIVESRVSGTASAEVSKHICKAHNVDGKPAEYELQRVRWGLRWPEI